MPALSGLPKQLFGAILLFVCAVVLHPTQVLSQNPAQTADRIKVVRAEIAAEESRHADAGILGRSWLALGKLYESQLQENDAEDAYAHALPLLQTAGVDAQYADALHGLGAVCVSSGRLAEGRKYLGASLAVYDRLGDRAEAANVHQALGVALLTERKYKEAQAEFSGSLTDLAAVENAPVDTVIAGYLMRANAESRMGNNTDALTDVARAKVAAKRAGIADNALERIAMSLAEGTALTRLGQADAGHASIEAAMRLASQRTDLPDMLYLKLQIEILTEYSASLQAVHRKQDVRQIKAELAHLQSQLPVTCQRCSVSLGALRLPGLP